MLTSRGSFRLPNWKATPSARSEVPAARSEREGAAEREVRDMKMMWIMGFYDPDAFYAEVIWRRSGVPGSDTLPRSDWTTVERS